MKPRRPVLRYHGGKWRLAPWIISHFPPHRIYVEPFGGAASVLIRKPRAYAEVYNDLDADVVNVFRVLRDPKKAKLLAASLELTPWSRREFKDSYLPTKDPVERARRTIVRCFMAHGSTSRRANATGFRAMAYRQRQAASQDWVNYPGVIKEFVCRLQGVSLEERPGLEIIAQQDTPATLFYVDPPYVLSTRSSTQGGMKSRRDRAYVVDLEDADHEVLSRVLHGVAGMVVISGYRCTLYDALYDGWERFEKGATGDRGVRRTEVIWLNPSCSKALEESRSQLEIA